MSKYVCGKSAFASPLGHACGEIVINQWILLQPISIPNSRIIRGWIDSNYDHPEDPVMLLLNDLEPHILHLIGRLIKKKNVSDFGKKPLRAYQSEVSQAYL